MTLREQCLAALSVGNVQAGLRVIRQGESTQDSTAYRRRWPGTNKPPAYFDDFTRHPRIFEPGPNGPSSAAGAYQITWTTYCDVAPKVGVTQFFPADQDLLAVALIAIEGALDDLIAGRFDLFLQKCAGRWASFPASTAGQPTRKYAELRDTFERYGGTIGGVGETIEVESETIDTQPPAPIEEIDLSGIPPRIEQPEDAMPEEQSSFDWSAVAKVGGALASFFNPFVGAAITSLSPLLQQKIEKSVGRHTDPATAKLVAANLSDVIGKTMTRETGKSDPVEALVAMKSNPAIVAKVEAAVDTRLDQLMPFIEKAHELSKEEWAATEKSMNDSVERTKLSEIGSWVQKRVLAFSQAMTLVAMIFTGALIAYQMISKNGEEPSGQLMILFVMLATMNANTLRSIADWGFGSSKSSAGKDLMLEEYAKRRKQ